MSGDCSNYRGYAFASLTSIKKIAQLIVESNNYFVSEVNGKFQNELLVYGKGGEHCVRCGHILYKTTLNGRGTTYCPSCQKSNLKNRIIGVTGAIGSGKSKANTGREKAETAECNAGAKNPGETVWECFCRVYTGRKCQRGQGDRRTDQLQIRQKEQRRK